MKLEKKDNFNKNEAFELILDKMLAISSFFFIWITTAYTRWRFYNSFIDV
ncbi:uncharacterized protein NESG_01337 [Nematocida ausubeli]|uniref:Uncharacterized protein n=1 Tax=Nematocida ausubeli (strain ATCC PRA-371 / ERTm2) TaxID=1913371 RepID=A0A086J253_NEMA1|nr:uncharacterized protein NESG_01337 [Nematocida ausubeli]KFG26221.1 hypothetical protein NESG_01337 [Nematocida ausubeli]